MAMLRKLIPRDIPTRIIVSEWGREAEARDAVFVSNISSGGSLI